MNSNVESALKVIFSKKVFLILLTAALIFAAAFVIRYVTYKEVGITMDEPFYVKGGIYYVSAAAHLSFFSGNWSYNYEHPPVSKYIYGVATYLLNQGNYDYNAFLISKVMSIICGCVTCVLVYFIGRRFFSEAVGILAALILAFTPMFIAHTQLSNIDSPVTMMVTATLLVFMIAVQTGSVRMYLASAFLYGLSLGTKYNSLLILPVMAGLYLLQLFYRNDRSLGKVVSDLLSHPSRILTLIACFVIVVLTFIVIWPYLWTNPIGNMQQSLAHWASNAMPEQLLGLSTNGGHDPIYYPIYFLVTTPEILLGAMILGLFYLWRSRDAFKITAAFWLIFPFAYGFSNFIMGGMRYILMIYPGLALVCAYGVCSLSGYMGSHVKSRGDAGAIISLALGALVVVSLLLTCLHAQPLYLDYYNYLSGGYEKVQSEGLFIMNWWGEGVYNPVQYVETHANNSTVLVSASLIMNANEYISMYTTNNTYSLAGNMGGGAMGANMSGGMNGNASAPTNMNASGGMNGNMPNGNMPTGTAVSQNGNMIGGGESGPSGPAPGTGAVSSGISQQGSMIQQTASSTSSGVPGPGGSNIMPGFGPNNTGNLMGMTMPTVSQSSLTNVTADYLIIGTNTGLNRSINTTEYTLVYQSIYNGVTFFDVYKRTGG